MNWPSGGVTIFTPFRVNRLITASSSSTSRQRIGFAISSPKRQAANRDGKQAQQQACKQFLPVRGNYRKSDNSALDQSRPK